MEAFMDTNPNNVLSASKDYCIYGRELTIRESCMVLVASDGCTSSLRFPAELEQLLLMTLLSSASPLEWEEKLKAAFGGYASDDYSLVLGVLGFENFTALKEAYRPRDREFERLYALPMQQALHAENGEALRRLWEAYKPGYLGKTLTIREAQS